MGSIIVLDDDREARRTISQCISASGASDRVVEVDTASALYRALRTESEVRFVFLDVCLQAGSGGLDFEGLLAAYDLAESFPSIPFAIISGVVGSHVDPIGELLHNSPNFISIRSKANLTPYWFRTVLAAGLEREPRTTAEIMAANEAIVDGVERETRRKLESDSLAASILRGPDWRGRLKAEHDALGVCTANSLLLCREIETQFKHIMGSLWNPYVSFGERVGKAEEVGILKRRDGNKLRAAWSVRNRLMHSSNHEATRDDAEALIAALKIVGG